jgi:hypothetical protein
MTYASFRYLCMYEIGARIRLGKNGDTRRPYWGLSTCLDELTLGFEILQDSLHLWKSVCIGDSSNARLNQCATIT